MEYKRGTSREQTVLYVDALDSIIEADNAVRVIDIFVNMLDLEKLGFKIPELIAGTPPYDPKVLLKIYIYGYLERIRSSRKLEKECKRNTEMIWLTENLVPDHWTISNFRKNNKEGIKNVFSEFLVFCKRANLISLETVGIDGSKFRAQNSHNNVFKRDTIDDVRKRIDLKIEEYLVELETNDLSEDEEIRLVSNAKTIKKLNEISKYRDRAEMAKRLFENNPEQQTYFASDPDARFQSDKGQVRPGYNGQIAVDDKNKLIIANDVVNKSNDLEQMSPMLNKVQEIKKELNIENKTNATLDAGYHNEKEILNNKDLEGIEIAVPDRKEAEERNKKRCNKTNSEKVPAKGFEVEDFIYDKDRDIYLCPEGKELYKLNKNPRSEKSGRMVYDYQCNKCGECSKRDKCTKSKKGRTISVSANKEIMEEFKKQMQTTEKRKLIQKRKEIVEHPFGTIKRNWGYTYFMQRGLEKVQAEFSLICFSYNFRRVLNILGVKAFINEILRQKQIKKAFS